MMLVKDDHYWLGHALALAQQAYEAEEVPVGAVVVLHNQIIGEGYNQPIKLKDPTAHAEILALRAAALNIENYRLIDATLYVTLEPCMMCAGSLIHARIRRLVYGANDLRAGAIQSNIPLVDMPGNHKIICQGGVRSDECTALLQQFFRARR